MDNEQLRAELLDEMEEMRAEDHRGAAARARGDRQAEKEMTVFARRLEKKAAGG